MAKRTQCRIYLTPEVEAALSDLVSTHERLTDGGTMSQPQAVQAVLRRWAKQRAALTGEPKLDPAA